MIYQHPLILQQLTESVNAANVDDDVDHVAAELVGLHIHRRGVGCNVDLNKLSHDQPDGDTSLCCRCRSWGCSELKGTKLQKIKFG